MKVLIVKGSDGFLDAVAVVGDDYPDAVIKTLRCTCIDKGGDLEVWYTDTIEDLEQHVARVQRL